MIEMISKGLKRAAPFWLRRAGLAGRGKEPAHRQVFGGFSGAVLALARAEPSRKPERGR
ncbi:hypothetical protein [Roseibium litorale]|uniref:Uncharacterized protein n=1 Tax=Roseibium litorale TaxID=2803841 RepID=A0ABR9CT95_9HYPH|nr:hypothetical protein [Roseibium litorale]MBD8893501.1 hypothetical protein [Roseibium litorale]